MNTGMLWFDNDPKTDIAAKVNRAVEYYRQKYGQKPNLCYVHPAMLNNGLVRTAGLEVRPNRQVMPNHFWLGVFSVPAAQPA